MDKKKFYEELVADVRNDFNGRREARRNYELQWRLNLNFLMGNQYCGISSRGDIEDAPKQYFWQEREVFNHIAPIVETRLAKLNRIKPSLCIRPASADIHDENAAKFTNKIIKSVWEENRVSDIISEANVWSESTGTVFYKVRWNSEKGRLVGVDGNNAPLYEGDIEVSVCPPFEIFPDSNNVSDVAGCASIIHAKAYPVKSIKDIWGEDVPGEQLDMFTMDNSAALGGLGYTASAPKIVFEQKSDYAVVIERYTRPAPDKPDGELTIIAGGKILYHGVLPYINDETGKRTFPFIRQSSISQAGAFFGISVIERLIPVQRAYNAVKNRKHEFLNRISMGVLAVEDGSVDTDNLEEEGLSPGKVLIYRQGSNPPRMLDPGNVPNDFLAEEDRLLSEFMIISGVNDSTKYAQMLNANVSGIALQVLIEQDDTRLSVAADNIKSAVKFIGQHILRLYKQLARTPRMKRIAGENGAVEMLYFNASEISSDDLMFDSSPELTETPGSRKNMVLEMLKLGLLTDSDGKLNSRTKTKVLEVFGFGNWEDARDISELHVKAAQRENISLDQGGKIKVLEVDDHEIHIGEHTKRLISCQGENDELILGHIREHKRFGLLTRRADSLNGELKTEN